MVVAQLISTAPLMSTVLHPQKRFLCQNYEFMLLVVLLAAGAWHQHLASAAASSWPLDDVISVSGNPDLYRQSDNDTLVLRLVASGGASWQGKKNYTHGIFSVRIKFPPGFTAGIVVTSYLISLSPGGVGRDEVDIELLGHTDPSKVMIHTNFYAHGNGSHEEQLSIWFDPTEFHTYTIIWSDYHILWLVDDIPIREHLQDTANPGGSEYVSQPMTPQGSIWDGSPWASRNSTSIIPSDYSYAPFEAVYTNFNFTQACEYVSEAPAGSCNEPNPEQQFAWDEPLSLEQNDLMKWYRRNYLHYSYLSKGDLPVEKGNHPPGVGG